MKNFLIFLFLSFAFLSAKEEEAPYLTSEYDTLALVEGVVNVFNGKFVQIDQDIKIEGQDSLEMTRYYDGGHHFSSEFGYGIGCSYPALLRFCWDSDKSSYVFLEMRMGCNALFEVKKEKNKNVYKGKISKQYFKSGYTNCCEALLRGEVSIYATEVEVFTKKAVVTLGDGTKRHYKHYLDLPKGDSYYLLYLEEKSNGNRRHFSYDYSDGLFRLKRISTTNRDETLTLNWLNFDYKGPLVTVRGSNGQEAIYLKKLEKGVAKKGNLLCGFKAKPVEEVLSQASIDHYPPIQYEVLKNAHSLSTIFSVTKVKKADGCFLEVEYDKNERVKKLFSSGVTAPLYTFDYHSGYTVVTDGRGAKKRFEFEKRRLTKLIEEDRTQNFFFDEKGQLTSYNVYTPLGALLSKQIYSYDEKGNILEVKLEGCLTKKDSHDTSTTSYSYSNENNLILNENHNGEVEYAYNYYPGTSLLASKLTYHSKQILEREFYTYDKNGILICKIVDDGSTQERDNLEQVSYRLITEIEPYLNPELSGMTLPHFITESYQDPQTKKKYLLKRLERFYTQGDLLAEEKVFDATDTYLYSLFYQYNDRRELISETNPLGETTIYAYDGLGNKTYEEKLDSGKKTRFIYDVANHLRQEVEEHSDRQFVKTYEYDALGNLLSSTDMYGQKTHYQYDLCSREISCTDPLGGTERREYDAKGNVTKFIDKDGYVTKTSYNLFNDPLEIYYPDASFKKFAYDTQGHLIQEWNRDGSFVINHVDYKGRVKEAHTYSSDGAHLKSLFYKYKGAHLIEESDALGNSTSYLYDGAGRKTAKIQGNVKTFYEYDHLGRLSKIKEGNCVKITKFDFLNRVIEERIEDLDEKIYHKVQYEYDLLGNLCLNKEYKSEEEYVTTRTLYNSQKLPILEINSLGFQTEISYCHTDHLKKEILDPSKRSTLEIYDPLLRLKEVKVFSSNHVLLAHTFFTYDHRGNQINKQEKIILEGCEIGTHTITATYDGMNQKIKETEQNAKTTEMSYKNGKLQTLKMADGVEFTYRYDPLGRLQEQFSSDHTIHYVYTYDLNDNLLQVDDLIHQRRTLRSYDFLNRIVYEKQASGFEYQFSYNDQNQMTKVIFCDRTIIYEYSPTDLLSASCYRKNKLLYTYRQKHDWEGKIEEAILPNQTKIAYERDKMGRCTQIDSPSYKQSLSYDPIGNLIETNGQDSIGSYQASFTYDGLKQLLSEMGPFENRYSHDSLYNRHFKNGVFFKIDSLNHLNGDLDTYHYDLKGRRTSKGNAFYSYDALDRLISFHDDKNKITFQYDSFGRRLSSTSLDSSTHYLYLLDTEIGAYEQDKLMEFRLTHGKATLAIELNENLYTPIRNFRGDICELQDDEQKQAATIRYNAFGIYDQEGTISSPWLFSGERYDHTTSLYHFDKREYDPHLGRWLTPDPLGFEDGSNRFAYVNNNPWIYVDPYGLFLTEVKDFAHGTTRGFIDDTSWHTSQNVLGNYHPTSTLGKWGYHLGTSASMAVGLCYGATEARVAKEAVFLAKGIFSKIKTVAPKAVTKPLRETHNIVKATSNHNPAKQIFEQVKTGNVNSIAKEAVAEVATKTGRHRFVPHLNATGAHSVFRRDPVTGKISKYETYKPQSNSLNPNPWESVKRFDGLGSDKHWNKALKKDIFSPHVHDSVCSGGIRPAQHWEIPN